MPAFHQTSLTVEFEAPEEFHQLPLHLEPDEVQLEVEALTRQIWPNGTEFQREAARLCYTDLTEALTADGALYSGVGIFETDDHRLSLATLLVRIEDTEPIDPHMACSALVEVLSQSQVRQLHQVDLPCGPAVVSFHVLECPLPDTDKTIPFTQIEVYVPAPRGDYLLIANLSTPSLAELPIYTATMSRIAESIDFQEAREAPGTLAGDSADPRKPSAAEEAAKVFG